MVTTGLLLLLVSFLARCGDEVQPVCLPHVGEDFESGMLYLASGLGKMSEVVEPKVEVDMSPGGNPMLIAGLGCGSVAILVEKRKIDTANYPGLYPSNTKCHWLIEAPAEYAVKLEFEDFAVELSPGCIYSSVAVYSDEEDRNELANLCGFSAPKPVLSPGNNMLVHFGNDGENSFRGFRAHLTIIHSGLKVFPPVCKRDFAARQVLVDLKSFSALFS